MSVNKYTMLVEKLATDGKGQMTCFGQSMMPILKSGGTVTFEKRDSYAVGDMVFAKVRGRYIDCHLITKVGSDGRFMIANNHGWENGWTDTIYGKAVSVTYKGETKEL